MNCLRHIACMHNNFVSAARVNTCDGTDETSEEHAQDGQPHNHQQAWARAGIELESQRDDHQRKGKSQVTGHPHVIEGASIKKLCVGKDNFPGLDSPYIAAQMECAM